MSLNILEKRPSLLSQDDVNKLYHHFLRIDSDGNGTISREELMNVPQVATNPLASRLIELFDTDDSGDISFAEFVAGLSIFSAKASMREKLQFAFDVYDLDKDGFISNGELFIVLRTMTGSQLTDVQLQQIVDRTIRDADADGDGRIGFDEFVRFVRGKNSDFLKMWSMADL